MGGATSIERPYPFPDVASALAAGTPLGEVDNYLTATRDRLTGAVATTVAEMQADLDSILPDLQMAEVQLSSLRKLDLDEVKAMRNPPSLCKLAFEAVCVLLQVKPARSPVQPPHQPSSQPSGPTP